MKGQKILMSQKQLQRFRVVGLVESGKITLEKAAVKIAVSYRQARRICKRVREKGARGELLLDIPPGPLLDLPFVFSC